MDLKGFILYIGAISLTDVNHLLTTGGLILNFAYIGYQAYVFHKKNRNDDENDQ